MPVQHKTLRSMIVSAMMTALAVALPLVFHTLGLGSKFLPMFLPLLLNAFLASWPWSIVAAVTAPWLSAALTGMPPIFPPVALIMSCECAVMAGVASALYRASRKNLWLSLLSAILLGRLTGFLLTWFFAAKFGLSGGLAASAVIVQGLPGVILQLILVPLALQGLRRRNGLLLNADD
jgi:thiamine transporter ThiT